MDRDQRSRRQSAGGPPPRRPQARSAPNRAGMRRANEPAPQPLPRRNGAQRNAAAQRGAPRPGPTPQNARPGGSAPRRAPQNGRMPQNPQSPGYRQGAAPRRRVTQAELKRRRFRRRLLGVLGVAAALVLGIAASITLLFKVTEVHVENFDRSTPANTGIYTEEQILSLLGVQQDESLLRISARSKTELLKANLPYLDDIKVELRLPGTVAVKVSPAVERFTMQYSGGWMILSDKLRLLRTDLNPGEGLIQLWMTLPQGVMPTVGQPLTTAIATGESAMPSQTPELEPLLDSLEQHGLLQGVTQVDLRDPTQLNVIYEDRLTLLLGSNTDLDYKLQLAAEIILDNEKGLSAADHGTLDLSYRQEDGTIPAYFRPQEAVPTPTPEPTEPQDAEPAPAG